MVTTPYIAYVLTDLPWNRGSCSWAITAGLAPRPSHILLQKDEPSQVSRAPSIYTRTVCLLRFFFLCNAKKLIRISTCLRNWGRYTYQMFVSSPNPQVGTDYCCCGKARSKQGSFTFCSESNEICGHSNPFWEWSSAVFLFNVLNSWQEESNMFEWIKSITERPQGKAFSSYWYSLFPYRTEIIQSAALPWHFFNTNLRGKSDFQAH